MADARDLMRAVLESAGARVTTANSAAEALTAVADDSFDLLLADIGMPGGDGYSLMEALRREASTRSARIPALAVSAYAGLTDRQRAFAAGFDRHIAKPVEPAALIEAASDVLAAARVGGPRMPFKSQERVTLKTSARKSGKGNRRRDGRPGGAGDKDVAT
jgi:CheY-like chemotaxis protein